MQKNKSELFTYNEVCYREKNGRVNARATVYFKDGTTKLIEGYGANKREAKKALITKVEEKAQELMYNLDLKAGTLTLSESVKVYLEKKEAEYDYKKKRNAVKQSTIAPIRRSCVTFIYNNKIGDKCLAQITIKDLETWRDSLACARYDKHRLKKGKHKEELMHYSSIHLNRAIKVVKQTMAEYYKGLSIGNPADQIKLYPQPKVVKTPEDFLIGKEFDKFVEYCIEKQTHEKTKLMADFFLTLLFTASREGECASMHVEDFITDSEEIYFRRNWSEELYDMKTQNSINIVPLIEPALSIVKERCSGRLPDERVFATPKGNLLSPGNIYNVFSKWIKEAGINKKLKPHALRGSMAIHMMDHGASPQAVADFLRDELSTVMKYYYTLTIQARDKRRNELREALSNIPKYI